VKHCTPFEAPSTTTPDRACRHCKELFRPAGLHNHEKACKKRQEKSRKENDAPAGTPETPAPIAETPDDHMSDVGDELPGPAAEEPIASDSEGTELSEYEQMRAKNMRRNEAMLVDLGLKAAAAALRPAAKKRDAPAKGKGANPKNSGQPLRRSSRNAAKTAAAAAAAAAAVGQPPATEIHPIDTEQNGMSMNQGDLFDFPVFTQAGPADEGACMEHAFRYYDKATGAGAADTPDKRAAVPEQHVAFAKLATSLNLSIQQSDEILRYIDQFGSSELPRSYKQGICKPIKEMAFAMDEFEHTKRINLTRNGSPCPGYTADATVPLRFSDPLWLAQELLMSPQVMKNKELVHFKSEQKLNSDGERCYSELYTGTW
jgi:hypothetical protein